MVFLQKHPWLSLQTTVLSFRKGTTGARAPKVLPLAPAPLHNPRSSSIPYGDGDLARPRGLSAPNFSPNSPILSSHGSRDDAGKSGRSGGRRQSVICCRCAAGVECFDGARDLTSQASLTSHTDHRTSPRRPHRVPGLQHRLHISLLCRRGACSAASDEILEDRKRETRYRGEILWSKEAHVKQRRCRIRIRGIMVFASFFTYPL
jgi:hypothetical protein